MNHFVRLNIMLLLCLFTAVPAEAAAIPIENSSFETPLVDPNGFGAVPLVDGWTEIDIDTVFSTNTGVFANTDPNSFDHIINADGSQLVFLGSQTGNALEQDLSATYKAGSGYRLTVGGSVSSRFPPSAAEPGPRGKTAVTPVRTGPSPTRSGPSPAMSVVWPTVTPATSVMAFSSPVSPSKGMPRSRARGLGSAPVG